MISQIKRKLLLYIAAYSAETWILKKADEKSSRVVEWVTLLRFPFGV